MRRTGQILSVVLLAACSSQSSFKGGAAKAPVVKPKTEAVLEKNSDVLIDAPEAAIPSGAKPAVIPSNNSGAENVSVPPNPPVSTVVFGGGEDGAFHLGDGGFVMQDCQERLTSTQVVGTIFEFHFRLSQNTTISKISIADICGVNYLPPLFNKLEFKNSNDQILASDILLDIHNGKGMSRAISVEYPPGDYYVKVSSYFQVPDPVHLPNGDFDDFIIGGLQVVGNAPIKRIGITTRGKNGEILKKIP